MLTTVSCQCHDIGESSSQWQCIFQWADIRVTSLLANDSTAFKWHCHWLKCLQQYHASIVKEQYHDIGKSSNQWQCIFQWADVRVTGWSANDSAAFKWKLHCHWLKGLWQCDVTAVIQALALRPGSPSTWSHPPWTDGQLLSLGVLTDVCNVPTPVT